MMARRHKMHIGEMVTARVLFGLALLGATLVLARSFPDLVRYLRVRRMS